MRIEKIIPVPGLSGFYFDDQLAIKMGAVGNGATYFDQPLTPGFSAVRQSGESLSIIFILTGGDIAYGDCSAVQYSGADGRDPLFLAKDFVPLVEGFLSEQLIGQEITNFREASERCDVLIGPDGKRLHTALRYGLTQAFLHTVALKRRKLMCEILVEEYDLPLILEPVPIFTQSGDDRYNNADKAIIKRADVLPHGLFNHVKTKLGGNGEKLFQHINWLRKRIDELGGGNYQPVVHIDVYGTIGLAFDNNLSKITTYLCRLEEAAAPLKLRIEGPVDMDSKERQIETMANLKKLLTKQGSNVEIVVDEWCNTLEDVRDFTDADSGHMIQVKAPDLGGLNNTVEAIIYARNHGTGAYLGGSCNETDRSAQVCVHVALASRPDQILAKPGMGLDEGMMIIFNEMQRALQILKAKQKVGTTL